MRMQRIVVNKSVWLNETCSVWNVKCYFLTPIMEYSAEGGGRYCCNDGDLPSPTSLFCANTTRVVSRFCMFIYICVRVIIF